MVRVGNTIYKDDEDSLWVDLSCIGVHRDLVRLNGNNSTISYVANPLLRWPKKIITRQGNTIELDDTMWYWVHYSAGAQTITPATVTGNGTNTVVTITEDGTIL